MLWKDLKLAVNVRKPSSCEETQFMCGNPVNLRKSSSCEETHQTPVLFCKEEWAKIPPRWCAEMISHYRKPSRCAGLITRYRKTPRWWTGLIIRYVQDWSAVTWSRQGVQDWSSVTGKLQGDEQDWSAVICRTDQPLPETLNCCTGGSHQMLKVKVYILLPLTDMKCWIISLI